MVREELKTTWSKHTEKSSRPKPSSVQLEKSIGQRMSEARISNADLDAHKNAFERNRAKPTPIVEKPKAPRTLGHVVEDPQLTEARRAEEQRKAKVRAEAARPQYADTVSVESEQDFLAIVDAWAGRHISLGDFHPSEFNHRNLTRCLQHNAERGVLRWNTAGLEAAHKFLTENGYYELPERIRGQKAAKEFPEYVPSVSTLPGNQQLKTRTTMTREENKQLRSLSFDELAVQAKAGFRKEKTNA